MYKKALHWIEIIANTAQKGKIPDLRILCPTF
jgi:hypothetical protein